MNIADLRQIIRYNHTPEMAGGAWMIIGMDTAEEMMAALLLLGCEYMPIIGTDDTTVGNKDYSRLVWIDSGEPSFHAGRLTQFLDSLEGHSEYS